MSGPQAGPAPRGGLQRRGVQRRGVLRAGALVCAGSAGVQFSAVLASGLFASLGVLQVSALRLLIAAVVLLLVFRPRLRGRSGRAWGAVVGYGVAMAAMNACLYSAIERIPLGIATTLDFLGPCVVALFSSRRFREALCALAAFCGVLLISWGPAGGIDVVGYALALAAAGFFGLYTAMAAVVGKAASGLGDLALSVAVAAVLTLPFSIPALPGVDLSAWSLLAASALLGVVFAFTMDTLAGRVADARVVGTWFAADPVLGSLFGWILLGQVLGPVTIAGIVLVVAAGAALVWVAGRHRPPEDGTAGDDPPLSDEAAPGPERTPTGTA